MQLKIVTWQNEDLASDALTIHGFEFYEATDYALATCDPLGRQGPPVQTSAAGTASGPHTRSTGEWLPNGREPLYYIISPKVYLLERQVVCACNVRGMLRSMQALSRTVST